MSKFLDENGLSYFWSKIKASLKTVAFTGSYNDLTNKPNIPQGATVDTELNSSSTNPVQNKAIHSALATKVTSSQAIQAVSGAGYATSANASAIASSLISAGGYVTSTYVAGATVTSAGTATNAGNATTVNGTAGTSTLSWNTDVTLATIGGNVIKAKLPDNPNTNTTYTFDTGDANGQIKVTPSGSTAQNVSVKGLGTAAYTSTGAFAAASHTHNYLPLTGGTLTGSLTISRGNPYLYFVETDWSKGTPQTSGTSYQGIFFSGSNAEGGHITFHYQQDKTSYLQLVCQNLTSAGANANTSIFVATAADGTKHVRPGANNDTDLGLSGYKWKNVYATTFSGALAGNATTATTAASCTGNAATATNASSLGGKAASQYLTAHQSLANYVTLNGTQTITGAKTFTDGSVDQERPYNCLWRAKSTSYTWNGTAKPASAVYTGIFIRDKADVSLGHVEIQESANGHSFLQLFLKKPVSAGSDLYVQLRHNYENTLKTFRPETTNLIALGNADNRWRQYFGSSSDSISSDERMKQQITDISNNLLDAWEHINWLQYKMNDAVEEKGDEKARFHTGLVAQRIQAVLQQYNVDASKYGFWGYDSWKAEAEEKNEHGEIINHAKEAGDEYSIRYEEALCIEAAYQRRRADRAEARISALEQRLNKLEEVLATLGDHSNVS